MSHWRAIADFLASPAAHHGIAPEVIDTHSARVVLAGDRAWKMRRPVDYGWMDYSTVERRLAMSDREVDLNRRTAPDLYLGVGWVVRDADDRMHCRAPGEDNEGDTRLEPAVVMRRFRAADLLDTIARRGELDRRLAERTGRAAAMLHLASEIRDQPVRLANFVHDEAVELAKLPVLDLERTRVLGRDMKAVADGLRDLAASRRSDGAVRFCHGDLHLKNIVLWHGEPAPFDSIEFNDDFAVIDVLYDLAFLLMDLIHRGLVDAASAALNGWAETMGARGEVNERVAWGGLALLPLFMAVRAAIRAKVGGLAAREDPSKADEARAYLDLAIDLLSPAAPPRLLAVGGRSGTGKSALARALAPGLGGRPGAVILRSDAIRKGLAGVAPEERLPPGHYTPESSREVYGAMLRRARMALGGGRSVILDAACLQPAERAAAAELARDCGVGFTGIWLAAPLELRLERIAGRRGDVSDATAELARRQETMGTDPDGWLTLDAGRAMADKVAQVAAACA
ncbi:MAG: AAA family ATPase [Pseudomonadota bacterium]|nr:AAA family ATPase [Pseudomonadota bacterium]